MRIDALLPRQGDCIQCPDPIPCNCAANQDCFQINRDCFSCSQTKCVARDGSSGNKSSGGASKGATAGAIIGALVFLAIAITLFLWYRRKSRLHKRYSTSKEAPKDVPAAAETVLNRPDPTEKPTPTPVTESNRSSNHYNPSRQSNSNNPFDDGTSIQTAGTEGTNVIPIALVPAPDSHRALSPTAESPTHLSATSSLPVRPARSPDLNLDHLNVSRESSPRSQGYAPSTISGITNRNSYLSHASFSSDFLNEAPMIITPNKGTVRQVLGVVKAEVINAPGPLGPGSDGLRPPPSRPTVTSPLAATSFGPADVLKEEGEPNDPFSDEASINANYGVSPAPTTSTFAHSSTGAVRDSHSEWIAETPNVPWAKSNDASRPASMSTQAGSVIDIGSATRVQLGLGSQLSPGSPYRTTIGRLITPTSGGSSNMQDQQQRAFAQAQALAQVQILDPDRRVSTSSAMSANADSILESFPFVPPSPISDRPLRSPLGQQSFNGPPPSPLGAQINIAPPSPMAQEAFSNDRSQSADDEAALPLPPNRKLLGLSTASNFSTASSGLGSFPFQIDSGDGLSAPPSSFPGRQRASLDTLALTSDLSSYPLGFDRDSVQVPMPPPRKS